MSDSSAGIPLAEVFEAYESCRRHKRGTTNALAFELDYEANLVALWRDINSGAYRPARSIAFIVDRPVKREIFAADFRDRVVHHLIINKLNPLFEREFMLDKESPVVVVADDGPVLPKLVSNIEEVRARGADVIAVATDGNEVIGELSRDVLWVPKTDHHLAPILTVIPLQLLAYHIAGIKGLNVDQPRNLAKTVTVE